MKETETRREVSMGEASGKNTNDVYRYYANGDHKPFTGILFAKYPNGNYSSWQEYVDGVGQGKWKTTMKMVIIKKWDTTTTILLKDL